MPKIIMNAEKIILDVATRMFLDEGYKKTSMRAVANASGVSIGTLYTYFDNKVNLFCHVALKLNLDIFTSLVRELSYINDPKVFIRKYVEFMYFSYYKVATKAAGEIINTEVEVVLSEFLNKSEKWHLLRLDIYERLKDNFLSLAPNIPNEEITRIELTLHALGTSFGSWQTSERVHMGNVEFIYKSIMNVLMN